MAQLRPCGIIFIFFATIAFTEEFNCEKQYNFSYELFKNGEYNSAISEFRRYLFFFPEDQKTDQAKFYVGLSFYLTDNKNRAIEVWESWLETIGNHEYKKNTVGFLMLSYFELDKSFAAENLLEKYSIYCSSLQIETIKLWMAISKGDFLNAASYCDKLFHETKFSIFSNLEKELRKIKYSKKSQFIAGALAIIPGAGYMYLERPGDGAFVFILNSLFSYLFIDAIRTENLFTSILWGGIEGGWYFANIYGSIRDARKHNRDKLKISISNLETSFLKFSFEKMNVIPTKIMEEF